MSRDKKCKCTVDLHPWRSDTTRGDSPWFQCIVIRRRYTTVGHFAHDPDEAVENGISHNAYDDTIRNAARPQSYIQILGKNLLE